MTNYLQIGAAFIPLILGSGTSLLFSPNSGETGEWYDSLPKSKLNPPGYVFPIVWSLLYVSMGVSLSLWLKSVQSNLSLTRISWIPFTVQLSLNLYWSITFFREKNPRKSLYVLLLLIASIVATIATFSRESPQSVKFMVPYLAWCLFALYLNYYVVKNESQST